MLKDINLNSLINNKKSKKRIEIKMKIAKLKKHGGINVKFKMIKK